MIARSTSVGELPELLRVDEAAAWADCSVGTLRSMIARGDLAAVRIGRLVRIPRTALAKLAQVQDAG